ncbi:MAG: ABC transporter substrate-binding protein [Propionibacteriaceae bacterium]|nr:ABC transporter substrate-binding protein [Propionibacteriaceae bacterium]
MKARSTIILGLAVGLAVSLSACGQPSNSPTDSPPPDSVATGGTLRVVGTDDHNQIDPVKAALVAVDSIMRATSRQLISYQASNDPAVNAIPQPDLAAELPTISEDGITYTFKMRENAMWDAATPRPITSKDMANGLKKICNPLEPASSITYFESIVGYKEYCQAYDTKNASVEDIKKHILEDSVPGIETPDDTTLIIKLNEPTSDFVYVLSQPNASPVPVEALEYRPNSPEYIQNFISSGPYTIDSYVNDKQLHLKKSAGWVKESDPIRAANVDRIEITYGVPADNAMQQLQSGDADVLYGMTVPPTQLTQLIATSDEKLFTWPSASTFFLWINSVSPNNKSALKDVKVRQALQYGVDKAAFVQQLGGPEVAEAAIGIFGSGVIGHSTNDLYASPGNAGDPEKMKSLLAEAGAANLKLKLAYRSDNAIEPAMAQIIQQSMLKGGVEIELVPKPSSDFYGQFMMVHETAKDGSWDIALCGWSPDWSGGAARSVFQPQFYFDGTVQEYNYTDYNNPKANEFMAKAMAGTLDDAPGFWSQVSDAVMEDPPVVPLYSRKIAQYHSERVGNFLEYALGEMGDWTNLTISE